YILFGTTFSFVGPASGVTGVYLSISTYEGAFGGIAEVHLPPGTSLSHPSVLNIRTNGPLGSVFGPNGPGLQCAGAGGLDFQGLTGSITGLDSINTINANLMNTTTGWLGDDPGDVVETRLGILAISANGARARILTDRFFDASDLAVTATFDYGGSLIGLQATAVAYVTNGP